MIYPTLKDWWDWLLNPNPQVAAKYGVERFTAWAAKIGIPCGCAERQADWNERFPYKKPICTPGGCG